MKTVAGRVIERLRLKVLNVHIAASSDIHTHTYTYARISTNVYNNAGRVLSLLNIRAWTSMWSGLQSFLARNFFIS